jgi:ammonia channel protein AmtB
MNKIKQLLGVLWMTLAVALVLFMFRQAYLKVTLATTGIMRTNTLLQWIIILLVFIPICAGLFIFGRYALNREFDELEKE